MRLQISWVTCYHIWLIIMKNEQKGNTVVMSRTLLTSYLAACLNGKPFPWERDFFSHLGTKKKKRWSRRGGKITFHIRLLEAKRSHRAVLDISSKASSRSTFPIHLKRSRIKLWLTAAHCWLSQWRVQEAPLMASLLVSCSDCTNSFPSVPLFKMDQHS